MYTYIHLFKAFKNKDKYIYKECFEKGVKRLALCRKLPPKNLKNMYLQSQSKLLGHFSVLLLLQCWCTKFGELTGINNIRRTRRQPEAQKTIFVWDCRLISFFIKILPTSYLASSLRREAVMVAHLPTTHPSYPAPTTTDLCNPQKL